MARLLTDEQYERMRNATGVRLLKKMTPQEINETFQRLQEENQRLRESLEWALSCIQFDQEEMPEAFAKLEQAYGVLNNDN